MKESLPTVAVCVPYLSESSDRPVVVCICISLRYTNTAYSTCVFTHVLYAVHTAEETI